MRKTLCIILLLCINFLNGQESVKTKEINSEVEEVTVFLKGAQITRSTMVQVDPGTTLLKFTNLSPFIRSKTVQLKSMGDVTVLSVNHSKNNLEKLEKSSEQVVLEKKWEDLVKQIEIEKTHLEVISEETSFLQENKNIGGKNQTLNVADLRSATDFYSKRLTELKLTGIERRERLTKLLLSKKEIEEQIKNISSTDKFVKGEIHVKIEAKAATQSNLVLTYLVNNAGWNPSYDIRAKNVNEPIDLLYKANVRQDTKVDWNNVKLTFSSVDPSTSGIAPELKTYFLDYYSVPPTYGKTVNEVSGFVFDSDKLPLPGANVMVKGTSIGTQTDFDGYYSLSVPDANSQLEYLFIGYKTQVKPITNEVQNVYLLEDIQTLDEVAVTALGITRNKKSLGYTSQHKDEAEMDMSEDVETETIPIQLAENQTSVEFTIDQPYSVKSDNQSFAVDMKRYNLPASYQYYCVPKVEKAAYLIASLVDWQKYNMLEGEANIFFEKTY
ncbi:mucoidy inhibitor MuiA family protein, partial [Lutimonas sp.]|uniref:mucoidy inhibitor MuiA family protein n=1 Tax=Lutimonas sp. TaxID=1872403 RepID=UPI003D9B5E76